MGHGESYKECCDIERRGLAELAGFLDIRCRDGSYCLVPGGRNAKLIQETVGDIVYQDAEGRDWWVEVKTEACSRTGNFFLEEWSNFEFGRQTVGWMRTKKSDILLYYFLDGKRLYSIPFRRLWEWGLKAPNGHGGVGRLQDFPLKPQRKHKQLNDTWGYCVPIDLVGREVGFRVYEGRGAGFVELPLKPPAFEQDELFGT